MTSAHRPKPLRGLRVGISGAVPDREAWDDVEDLDQLILRFVAQLSALVMKYGGTVVHGSHPTFTPVLTAQAPRVGEEESPSLTLIASLLFGDPPPVVERARDVSRVVLTGQVGEGDWRNRDTLNNSLTAMRMLLVREVDVIVAVGGKLHATDGRHPGVLEELTLARWEGIPCFLVGVGGFTGRVDDDVARQFSDGNRLAAEDVRRLAAGGTGIDTAVGSLLEHLVIHAEEFRRNRIEPYQELFAVEHFKNVDLPPGDQLRVARRRPPRLERVVRVDVDADAVRGTAERFARVRAAFEKGDAGRVASLISGNTDTDRGLVL